LRSDWLVCEPKWLFFGTESIGKKNRSFEQRFPWSFFPTFYMEKGPPAVVKFVEQLWKDAVPEYFWLRGIVEEKIHGTNNLSIDFTNEEDRKQVKNGGEALVCFYFAIRKAHRDTRITRDMHNDAMVAIEEIYKGRSWTS